MKFQDRHASTLFYVVERGANILGLDAMSTLQIGISSATLIYLSTMHLANALSMATLEESVVPPESNKAVCVVASHVSHQEYLQITSKDKTFQQVIQWVQSAWPPGKESAT